MAYFEKLNEKEILDFYKTTYKKDSNKETKTLSTEADLISTGWFVKETFIANKKLTGHAFIFCEHKVLYVPSSDEEYISQEKRDEYEKKYIEFLISKFGKDYKNDHIRDELETMLKQKREHEQQEKFEKAKALHEKQSTM